MTSPDFLSALPLELISVLLRCILLQYDHTVLFSFLKACPHYCGLVLIIHPPYPPYGNEGIDTIVPDIKKSLNVSMLCLNLCHTTAKEPSFTPHELSRILRASSNLLRVLLVPHCEYHTIRWSHHTFTCSILARAIEFCDVVVVGRSESQSKYRGLGLIREWCTLVKTPLKVYITPTRLTKSFFQWLISPFFVQGASSFATEEFTYGRAPAFRSVRNVTFRSGYHKLVIAGNSIKNYRIVLTDRCLKHRGQLCSPPVVHQKRAPHGFANIRSIYLEFSSCRIPRITSAADAEDWLRTFFGVALVLENMHWSSDNPFGRDVCNHAREAGVHFQADYWDGLEPGSLPLLSFNTVELIGVPEALAYSMTWKRTRILRFKRLESKVPAIQPGHFQCLSLDTLEIEATSNDLYYGSLKIDAPLLKWLTITMLSESTRMWDLNSLLFHQPFANRTELISLTLEHNGGKNIIELTSMAILPVASTLEILCINGLYPSFLVELHGDVAVNFPKLEYLLLDSSLQLPNKAYLDPSKFPRLKQLVLNSNHSTTASYPLNDIYLDPVPRSLETVAIDRNFSRNYQVTLAGQVLVTEKLEGYLEGEWEIWKRELNQTHFENAGIVESISPSQKPSSRLIFVPSSVIVIHGDHEPALAPIP